MHLLVVSDGSLGRAAIRGTADTRLASHVYASSNMSDICVPIMHLWKRDAQFRARGLHFNLMQTSFTVRHIRHVLGVDLHHDDALVQALVVL